MSVESRTKRPPRLYHGTNNVIHTSREPFLNPRRATYKRDIGEPHKPLIMATPHKVSAELFAIKTSEVKVIFHDIQRPVIIFDGEYLPTRLGGFRYEIPSDGFQQVMRHGEPTDKWYKLAEDMEEVMPGVKGISLKNVPRKLVTMESLITEHEVRIYWHHNPYVPEKEIYHQKVQDAIKLGSEQEFLQEGVQEGWLADMTEKLKKRYSVAASRFLA